jgi:hypothetical protein
MEYVDTALLTGIFWRMGGFHEGLKIVRLQLSALNYRVNKLEKELKNEATI